MDKIIKGLNDLFKTHNVVATMCKVIDGTYQICGSTSLYNLNIMVKPHIGEVEVTATSRVFDGQKLKITNADMHNVVGCVKKFIDKGLIETDAHNITVG